MHRGGRICFIFNSIHLFTIKRLESYFLSKLTFNCHTTFSINSDDLKHMQCEVQSSQTIITHDSVKRLSKTQMIRYSRIDIGSNIKPIPYTKLHLTQFKAHLLCVIVGGFFELPPQSFSFHLLLLPLSVLQFHLDFTDPLLLLSVHQLHLSKQQEFVQIAGCSSALHQLDTATYKLIALLSKQHRAINISLQRICSLFAALSSPSPASCGLLAHASSSVLLPRSVAGPGEDNTKITCFFATFAFISTPIKRLNPNLHELFQRLVLQVRRINCPNSLFQMSFNRVPTHFQISFSRFHFRQNFVGLEPKPSVYF